MSSSSDSESQRERKRKNNKKNDEWGENDIIASEVLRTIEQSQGDHHLMFQARQQKCLKLKVIEKKPYYLSDGVHCIQASFKPMQTELNPLNLINTQFYAGHSKPHIVFNCHDEIMEQQKPLYPSAYHPAYHYKCYEQFEQRRRTTQVLVSCQRIEVVSWSIQIVNISRSGYYGPVLILHESRRGQGENILLEKRVQNILFYKQLSPFLDEFRIRDLRKVSLPIQRNIFSLMYYTRDRKTEKRGEKISTFSNLDSKNQIIASNKNLPINFVAFGEMSQYEIFKRPVNPKFLNKKNKINLNSYIESEKIGIEENNNSENQSNQSSSFIQNNVMENQGEQNEMNPLSFEFHSEEEDEEEQDDYLKKVYEKAMINQSYL